MNAEFDKAKQYYINGEFDKAIVVYQSAVKEKFQEALAYQGLAQCYFRANRIDDAYQACIKALDKDDTLTIPRLIIGKVFIQQSKLDDAESILKKALTINPAEVDTYLALSTVYSLRGCIQESISVLHSADRLDSRNWKIHYNLAVDLRTSNLHPEAIREFWVAFRLSPTQKTISSLLAAHISLYKVWYAVVATVLYIVGMILCSTASLPLIVISAGYCFLRSYLWYLDKNHKEFLLALFMGIYIIGSFFLYLLLTT